jgi:hypothetical protein
MCIMEKRKSTLIGDNMIRYIEPGHTDPKNSDPVLIYTD